MPKNTEWLMVYSTLLTDISGVWAQLWRASREFRESGNRFPALFLLSLPPPGQGFRIKGGEKGGGREASKTHHVLCAPHPARLPFFNAPYPPLRTETLHEPIMAGWHFEPGYGYFATLLCTPRQHTQHTETILLTRGQIQEDKFSSEVVV